MKYWNKLGHMHIKRKLWPSWVRCQSQNPEKNKNYGFWSKSFEKLKKLILQKNENWFLVLRHFIYCIGCYLDAITGTGSTSIGWLSFSRTRWAHRNQWLMTVLMSHRSWLYDSYFANFTFLLVKNHNSYFFLRIWRLPSYSARSGLSFDMHIAYLAMVFH